KVQNGGNQSRSIPLSGSDSDLLPPRSRYPEHGPGRADLPPPGSASGLNFFQKLEPFRHFADFGARPEPFGPAAEPSTSLANLDLVKLRRECGPEGSGDEKW